MSKYQYRIKEMNGKFTVQALTTETKGFLWWKKEIKDWKPVDINGIPCFYFLMAGVEINTYKIKLDPFNNMADAEKKIEQFIWPDIKYHYPFGKPGRLPHFENPPPAPPPLKRTVL